MKTILSIFTAVLCLGVLSTVAVAGPVALREPEGGISGRKTPPAVEPRKGLQAPVKPQALPRSGVRPALKKSESFKPLPGDDRRKIDGSGDLEPVK
ncbi:MAG: hypothetical protein EG826_07520 [Deltaproteobacteria bacterium]|nr:hypothetical protein [Deltaproteobacteria bacterium]